MLDVQSYRMAESQAKAKLGSWREMQIHHLGAFERVGFPTRVEALPELAMLLDSMQDGRGEAYRREIMDDVDDVEEFNGPACDQVAFSAAFFGRPVIAVDAMTATLCLYRKLKAAAPAFKRVLEIGPGCGYLAFFLKDHPGLGTYTQVEACESFYLLQHLVGLYCFSDRMHDRARSTPDVFSGAGKAFMFHEPWWRVEDLFRDPVRYDVVTANACLLEFSPPALDVYLRLAAHALPPGGKFVSQCLGSFANGTPETLRPLVEAAGFKTLRYDAPSAAACTWNAVWERTA